MGIEILGKEKEKPNYLRIRVSEILVIPAHALDEYLHAREKFREEVCKYGGKIE